LKVKNAIEAFVPQLADEPGTRMYFAWRSQQDPTRFIHFYAFENDEAFEAHTRSAAFKEFESVYLPEVDRDDVVVTECHEIAGTQHAAALQAKQDQHKEVVREFTRIFRNEHNVDDVRHLFHQDFVHNFRKMPDGFEGLRQFGLMMNTAFPDMVMTSEDLIAAGNMVVERISAVATHLGPLMGVLPTNRTVKWTGIHIYEFDEGKIIEHWGEVALLELL